MSTMNVLVRRKEVSDRGIIQSHTFPSSDHVAKNGLWEFGKGRPILPKHHLDSTVARGSGSRDPVLMGVGKEQKTSLGTRVLHRARRRALGPRCERSRRRPARTGSRNSRGSFPPMPRAAGGGRRAPPGAG